MVVRMEMVIVSSCESAEVKPVEMNISPMCTLVSVRIPPFFANCRATLGAHICFLIF